MAAKTHLIRSSLVILAVMVGGFSLSGCQKTSANNNQLIEIKERGELRIGTLYSPLTYVYDQNDDHTGYDYELAQRFADHLGVKLKVIAKYTPKELPPLLKHNAIDLIALPYTPMKGERVRKLSPELHRVDQVLVYRSGSNRPTSLDEVTDTIWVVKGSPQERLMQSLTTTFPKLPWQATADADEEELLRKIAVQEIALAVIDSNNLSLNQRFYPSIARAITLKESTPVYWQLSDSIEDSLQVSLVDFIGQLYQSGQMDKLKEKYFGQFDKFDYVDTRQFLKAIKTRLPKYEELFKKHAGELDWRLLASVSYQESHWRPKATSPTGVRGLMMLTLDTAKHLGIKNRLDPEQSIQGGAQYLTQLLDKMPESIPVDEKIWFALASYNIGFGHLMDARRITKLRGYDPDSWGDVKDNLPLLMQRRWNQKTRYGYARGAEAANYVLNIRQYYQSLVWKDEVLAKEKAIEEQNEKFRKLLTNYDDLPEAALQSELMEDPTPLSLQIDEPLDIIEMLRKSSEPNSMHSAITPLLTTEEEQTN